MLKDMILMVLCAYRVSGPVVFPSGTEIGDLSDLIGAVKERRIVGGDTTFSGVDGADTSAISYLAINEFGISDR